MPKGVYKRNITKPIDRFWQKIVIVGSGCWEWQAGRTGAGYGRFYNGDKTISAHRWSYEYFKVPIPKELVIDHLCRNPACANPDHLECVPMLENTMRGMLPDMLRAKWKNMTHCKHGHEFTEESTGIHSKKGTRYCRICQKHHARQWCKKNRATINMQQRLRRQQNGKAA